MSSRFIHVVEHGRIPLLFKAESYSTVCVFHIFSTCLSNRHLGCCHIMAIIVNNIAVNVGVQIFLQDANFIAYGSCISRSGTAGSFSSSTFNLLFLNASKVYTCMSLEN